MSLMAILTFFLVCAIAVFAYAGTFPTADHFRSGNWVPGPGFFPRLLAIVLFAASGIELLRAWRQRAAAAREKTSAAGQTAEPEPRTPPSIRERLADWGVQNVFMILILLFSFPFLLERVGFAIMGFLTVFLITWRLKAGLARSALFAAVAVTLTMYFFRYVFFMDLPPGLWSPTL